MNENILLGIKERMMKHAGAMKPYVESIGKNPKRPLGKFNPWAWWVEFVRGCNLRCGFCPTALFDYEKQPWEFITTGTWVAMLELMREITPYTRLELCQAGEPTLHPELLSMLKIAREILPNVQLLIYTNGVTIANGELTYKQLFDAGVNMVFLDMYAPLEIHSRIANDSGYYWYYQDDKPENAPNVFQYQNDPNIHVIMLANNPTNWSKRKLGRGYLQTFLNDLDWEAAKPFGLTPVTKPPKRRCDLPFKFVSTFIDGEYDFCCFDYMRHTANRLGNVKDGVEGFFKFWLGRYMQGTRKKVWHKDRASHPWCSKCSFTSIRCDIPYWRNKKMFKQYWDGEQWRKMNNNWMKEEK